MEKEQAAREVGMMTTMTMEAKGAKTTKCAGVIPVASKDAKGQPLRYGTCPECGGYLAILNSGFFRTHKPVMKPGNPQIAINVANAKARK